MFILDAKRQPHLLLTSAFLAWKLFLLAIARWSVVGPAYDTSTTLMMPHFEHSPPNLLERLTKWDGIWFTASISENYSTEAYWAFGWGLSTVVSLVVQALEAAGCETNLDTIPLVGILLSNFAHFASVLVLYHLARALTAGTTLAVSASILHIISPAGIFLSAPYSESLYALSSFTGYLLYAWAIATKADTVTGDFLTISSGLLLGIATLFRSNGLLNGIVVAAEFASHAAVFIRKPTIPSARRVVALGIAGLLVGTSFLLPQAFGYMAFCTEAVEPGPRPWCSRTVPSIYAWVQERYWNVGFLRYWTSNNIPNFVLAAPMISVLIISAVEIIHSPGLFVQGYPTNATASNKDEFKPLSGELRTYIRFLAIPQLILACLSITNYHVQVITRLSSGYPLWCLWLAAGLGEQTRAKAARGLVVFLVMYASIQAVLFSYFIPPA